MLSKTFLKKSLPLLLIALFLVSLLFVGPSTPQRAGVDPVDQPPWGVLGPSPVEAGMDAEPRCLHNVCVANCLAQQCFLGWDNFLAYDGWFGGVYEGTGCGDVWGSIAGMLLSLAGSAVGAPSGGATLSCWQLLMAEASLCSDDCSSFHIKNCCYAPNVHMSLDTGSEGYTAITVDNRSNLYKILKYQPNAYSRDFNTYFYLSYEEGQKLLLENWYVPSLSYPNWIISGGLDDCLNSLSPVDDDTKCKCLASFVRPSSLSRSLDWGLYSGGLIDLTGFTDNAHSYSDGYIALKGNGDSITIEGGHGLSGYMYEEKWSKRWNETKWTYSEKVEPWSTDSGDHTVTNQEHNSWWDVNKLNRDTYVFATEGPSDNLLLGNYTVEVEADLSHDRDINDNTVSYTYDLTGPPSGGGGGGTPGDDGEPPPIQAQDIGEDVHQGSLSDNERYDMYKLEVPKGLVQLKVTLDVPDNADFDLYMALGYEPRVSGGGCSCCTYYDVGMDETCELTSPREGTYYIRVHPCEGSGDYTLTVEFIRLSQYENIGEESYQRNLSDSESDDMYHLYVPADVSLLRVHLGEIPAGANFDLYIERDRLPTETIFYSRSCNDGNMDETCELVYPTEGDYYVMMDRKQGSGNYSLTVEFVTTSEILEIEEDTYQGNLSFAKPDDFYSLDVPSNLEQLRVHLEILDDANFDLYLSKGRVPTIDSYDYKSSSAGSANETCELTRPSSDRYYIMVHRCEGFGDYNLTIDFVTTSELQEAGELENEPNDDFSTANQWDISKLMHGKLDVHGDQDRFQFVALQSGLYTLHLTDVPANIEPDLKIYNPGGHGVASDYSTGAGESVSLTIDANAGETYFVMVDATSPSQISDQLYTLSMTIIPDPNEPDDTFDQATVWDFTAGPAHGYFWERVSGPSDYYVFTVPDSLGSVLLTVHLTDVPANVEPNLKIYNPGGHGVASDYSAGAGDLVSLTIDANAGETYFVRVDASSPYQMSDQLYTLSVTIIPDPNEPDDTFDQATVWDFTSGPVQGYFWERVSGPSDYYVFTVPDSLGSMLLTVHLTDVPANVEPNLKIYNPGRHGVASDYSAGAGDSVSLTINANVGETYFVRVDASSPYQVSDQLYTLSMTTDDDTTPPSDDDITPPSGGVFTWDDIPIYPGAELVAEQSFSIAGWSRTEWRCYQTGDSESMVIAFYQSQMPTMGWQEIMRMKMKIEEDYSYYTKNQAQDTATVTIQSDEGPTVIAIMRSSR